MAYNGTNFNTPALDGQNLERQLAPILMGNIVVGIQQKNGRGVTETYSSNTTASEIQVIRRLPVTFRTRTMGATTNGGYFNSKDPEQPKSIGYGVKILHTIDNNMDIPEHMEGMVSLPIAQGFVDGLMELMWREMNASTMAEQILKSVKGNTAFGGSGNTGHEVIAYDKATDNFLEKLFDAGAVLDNGDALNGIDAFDYEGRIALVRPTAKRNLVGKLTGVYSINNWKAQEMLTLGALEPGVKGNVTKDGYYGDIDQTPIMVTPAITWSAVEAFLGLTAGALDDLEGMLIHSSGTLRAVASTSRVKVIPSPVGAGLRMQPCFRWGHETIFPKAVVLIGKTTKSALNTAITATEVLGKDSQ